MGPTMTECLIKLAEVNFYRFVQFVTICFVLFNFVTFCYAARMKPQKSFPVIAVTTTSGKIFTDCGNFSFSRWLPSSIKVPKIVPML